MVAWRISMAATAKDCAQTAALVRPVRPGSICMYFRGFVCYWVGNLGIICLAPLNTGKPHANFRANRLLISVAWQTATKIRPPLVYYYPNIIAALAKPPSYSAPYITRSTCTIYVQQPEDPEWIILGDTSVLFYLSILRRTS